MYVMTSFFTASCHREVKHVKCQKKKYNKYMNGGSINQQRRSFTSLHFMEISLVFLSTLDDIWDEFKRYIWSSCQWRVFEEGGRHKCQQFLCWISLTRKEKKVDSISHFSRTIRSIQYAYIQYSRLPFLNDSKGIQMEWWRRFIVPAHKKNAIVSRSS